VEDATIEELEKSVDVLLEELGGRRRASTRR
jgi:hypothetical protein